MSYHNDTTFQKSIIFVFENVAYEQNMWILAMQKHDELFSCENIWYNFSDV